MAADGMGPPLTTRMRWRRLDVPGSDECELRQTGRGWHLAGVAEFRLGEVAARLGYEAECDPGWRTVRGAVRGAVGSQPVQLTMRREASGEWIVDDAPADALRGLIDLDLGFTPATNLFPLRRLALRVGEAAEAEAAWLDEETWSLRRLPQRYERRDATRYWYESPTAGYADLLTVSPDGFIREYPGLWVAAD